MPREASVHGYQLHGNTEGQELSEFCISRVNHVRNIGYCIPIKFRK